MHTSHLFSLSLLLPLAFAQIPCGDPCPGANGYLILAQNSGHNYQLLCGTDLNQGTDLDVPSVPTSAAACAQSCENWNANGFGAECTGAVWNPVTDPPGGRCVLKSGELVQSGNTYGDALVRI